MFSVHLFGTFRIRQNNLELDFSHSGKARELLCYILLHRHQPHSRNILANCFWTDHEESKSRKYLRQSLWQLQRVIPDSSHDGGSRLLNVDGDSIVWNAKSDIWVDIDSFEAAFARANGLSAEMTDSECAEGMRRAVALYEGDLLEGWYQDWCLFHRERLQNMYISMLERLMDYCELQREYDDGLTYGARLLQQDRVRERTYVRMMRLQYQAGDRTGALRLFQRCAEALAQELGVKPSRRALDVYEQIKADRMEMPTSSAMGATASGGATPVPSELPPLSKLKSLLLKIQQQVQEDIQEVNQAMASRSRTPPEGMS